MTDFSGSRWYKRVQVAKIIYEYKEDLEFLKILQNATDKAINNYDNMIKEKKLQELISDYKIKIIKYLKEDDVEKSRSCMTLEFSLTNNSSLTNKLKIYKQTSYSKSSDDILEEFYISLDDKKIYNEYDDNAYKINTQIEDKTLKISIKDDVIKNIIFTILHFFEFY